MLDHVRFGELKNKIFSLQKSRDYVGNVLFIIVIRVINIDLKCDHTFEERIFGESSEII